jgi:hypothetical protein
MKYIIKNIKTCKYVIDKETETYNIDRAFCIITDEDSGFVETYLSLNTIYPLCYEICLYKKELIMIRKNKLKKLNYFL